MKLLVILLALLVSTESWAKPLYFTVRRDFGPDEKPKVEVNYSSNLPITFRVLKPKDMSKFISSQIDLRRSWKKPQVEINTSRYLLQGMNKANLNLRWVRYSLDGKMRKKFSKTLGNAPSKGQTVKVGIGPEKLIGTPENFELVTEFSTTPEGEDTQKGYDVPGFNWWWVSGGSLNTRNVEFPPLAPGFYLIQAVQGELEGQVIVVVNNIVGQLQQSDNTTLIKASDRKGNPLKDIEVKLRNLNGDYVKTGKTDANGVIEFKGVKDSDLVTVLEGKTQGTAVIDSEYFSTVAVFEDLYLYTDRPMYKPGDTVKFRGIIREKDDGLSILSSSDAASIQLIDTDGTRVREPIMSEISPFGTFTGEFTIPETASSGVLRIDAEVEGKSHIGEIRVKDYVKPVFFVKINTKQETLRPGAVLSANLKIERYAGGVPNIKKVKWELFRSRMDAPQWVEDAGLGETGSEVTYWNQGQTKIRALIPVDDGEARAGRNGRARIVYKIPKDLKGDPNYDYKFLLKVTVEDDDYNFASASKSFIDMKSENMAQARMSAAFAGKDFPAKLLIRSIYPSGKAYGKTKGQVKWFYGAYGQDMTELKTEDFETSEAGRVELPVPNTESGRVTAQVRLFDNQGAVAKTQADTIVLSDKLETGVVKVDSMQLLSRRDYFSAGEVAKGLVMLPENWGANSTNEGHLYVTVVGEKVFETRVQKVKGLATWIEQKILKSYGTGIYIVVSYMDPIMGWQQRKFVYRIPQKDKYLKVKLASSFDNLMPGTEQTINFEVTDGENKPVETELSVSVVDKAVLDLQPEFRPSIIDFFYPQTRLNLMTFTSGQFQSYGYGEKIVKMFRPNYVYSAEKAEAEELKEEDTAHWTGQVVTDSNGKGSVTFRLPGNQTIWVVSAVGADKRGRFGEGQTEFTTNMPVSTILALPSFLRKGDKVQARLNLENNKDRTPVKISYVTEASGPVTIDKAFSYEGDLPYRKPINQYSNITLNEDSDEPAKLVSSVKLKDKDLKFSYDFKAMTNLVEINSTVPINNEMTSPLTMTPDSRVKGGKIVVTKGLFGAMAPSLRWLVQYPHGCVEQTANKVMPMLAIQDVLSEFESKDEVVEGEITTAETNMLVGWWKSFVAWITNLWSKFLSMFSGESQGLKLSESLTRLLGDAGEYSEAGLSKLSRYQDPRSGGFLWFPGSTKVNERMTLYVLYSLASTDRKSFGKIDVSRAYYWLKGRVNSKAETILMTYIESRLAHLEFISSWESQRFNKAKFAANEALKGSAIEKAWALMAIKYFKIEDEKEEVASLVSTLGESLSKDMESLIENDDFKSWGIIRTRMNGFLGTYSSSIALAARALHETNQLSESIKGKLVKYLLRRFNGKNFGSTFETGQTLIHSAWLLKEDIKKSASASKPKLEVNGQKVKYDDENVVSNIAGFEIELDPKVFVSGENSINLKNSSDYLSSHLDLKLLLPPDEVKSKASNMSIEKRIYKISSMTDYGRVLKDKNFDLKMGDLLYVELRFKDRDPDGSWNSSEYYMIQDDLPAGMTVIEEGIDNLVVNSPRLAKRQRGENAFKYRKIQSDKITWYFKDLSRLMSNEFVVGYFLRANFAGEFSMGVAKAEDFYDEESFAYTDSRRVSISSGK